MTIAEDRLLAYADGRLPSDEAAEVERAIADDAEAQAFLATLRASDLPYRDAAEALLKAPDLSDIEQTIAEASLPARRRGRSPRQTIAASLLLFFVAGLLAGHYALPPLTEKQSPWTRWLDRIASYQSIYTRETLSLPTPPPDRRAREMAHVARALGKAVSAPDLTAQGADFKFAWIYAIDGAPLAQIAYLPSSGKPFSLCMARTDQPDHGPRYTTMYGMQLATWRHDGIAWVFVGDVSRADMDRYIAAARAQVGS